MALLVLWQMPEKGAYAMNITCCLRPIDDELRDSYRGFLAQRGLGDDDDWQILWLMRDDEGSILATAARAGKVIKQIAVSPEAEGTGACAAVMSELLSEAYSQGISHLFIYTKPRYRAVFSAMGFSPLAETPQVLLMENRKDGVERYLAGLPCPPGENGAVVCNCDPFTLGHRYLIEQAASMCQWLHVFVVSEQGAMFSPEQRIRLVREGTADIKNCLVHQSDDYIISRATFPSYFLKDKTKTEGIRAELDIALFGSRIAPALGIVRRFVGTEPFCRVTNEYNKMLKNMLPGYGIELIELERLDNISAGRVRQLIAAGETDKTRELVPETTYEEILRCFK